jgi:uncharacterized membrane protein
METFLLLGLFVAGGYVLGVIGFFRAQSAHTELRILRRTLAEVAARTAPAETPEAAPAETPEAAPVPPRWPSSAEPVEPMAEAAAPPQAPEPKPARDLETLLTARWGVWLGSAALLLAGVFLIRYAVEQELLGPAARCVLAALLGAALLAAAEWLTRHEAPAIPGPFRIDQTPPALAAGGTAVLFGAAYWRGPVL